MLQNISCRRVDSAARYSRLQRISCRRLRIQNRVIPLADTRRRLTNVYSARKVAAVAAQYSTQVQYDQLVFPDSARGRTRMWQRRARSRSHDGLEGLSGCALSAHPVSNLGSDVKFGDTGTDQPNCFLHNMGTQAGRVPDAFNLSGILNGAETLY